MAASHTTYLALIIAAVYLSTVSAQWQWGRCRVEPVVDDFDPFQMQGRWYEAFFTPNVPILRGDKGRCQYLEFRIVEEGQVGYRQVGIYSDGITNMTSVVEGRATYNVRRPTLWQVRENRFTRGMNYWTLDTDYRTFAFVQYCVNRFLFFREEYTWVLLREREATDESLYDYIANRFIATGLDGSNLLYADQAECPEVDDRWGQGPGDRDDQGMRDPDDSHDQMRET